MFQNNSHPLYFDCSHATPFECPILQCTLLQFLDYKATTMNISIIDTNFAIGIAYMFYNLLLVKTTFNIHMKTTLTAIHITFSEDGNTLTSQCTAG